MKSTVQAELTIPRQTRYLLPIELGRIERHVSVSSSMLAAALTRLQVYDHNFEQALLELGLDARGVAVSENWEVDTTVLRSWLRKLRGICTHPQVGQLQNQADKLHKPGVLKSIGEVLEVRRGLCPIAPSSPHVGHERQELAELDGRLEEQGLYARIFHVSSNCLIRHGRCKL